MGEDNVIEHPRKPLADRMPLGAQPKAPMKFMKMDDLARARRPVDWLIKGIIECKTHSMLFGDPESGKTLVLFDMLYSIASGRPWRNRRVKQGPVFYLCGEGQAGLGRRADAWRLENNIPDDVDLPFYTSEQPAALLDELSAQSVCDGIMAMAVEYGMPIVVGIDTLARNFGGGDENSAKDIGKFIEHIDRFLTNALSCAVITSHHTGHGVKDRARGSMSLPGALDTFYQVQKEDKAIVMTCKKSKDFEKADPIVMKLQVHELGYTDEDGDPVTGATVRHDPDFKHTIKPATTMPKPQKFCYDILCELYEQARGRKNAMGKENENVDLDFDEWCRQCIIRRAGPGAEPGSTKWNNARKYIFNPTKELIANGVVRHRPYGPFIYPAGAD